MFGSIDVFAKIHSLFMRLFHTYLLRASCVFVTSCARNWGYNREQNKVPVPPELIIQWGHRQHVTFNT